MSRKNSIVKSFIVALCIAIILIIVGISIIYNVNSDALSDVEISAGCITTSAVIEDIEVKEHEGYVSKGRKVKKTEYSATVRVNYEGNDYWGVFGVSPFDKPGSDINVFFDTATGEVKPSTNTVLGAIRVIFYIPGIVLIGIGGIVIIVSLISTLSKLSIFRDENKTIGVIAEVVENENIVINHQHPQKAICEFTDPFTGEARRAESNNSTSNLFSMIGKNVEIYVSPKNPQKVFVDLDSAYGAINVSDSLPKVNDFRNL